MKIGLLLIGTELLQGKIQDLNQQWLGHFLRPWNLTLDISLTTSDSPEQLQRALGYLYQECSLVITSGGLGPTLDDITKKELANYFGLKIEGCAEAKQMAQVHYQRIARPFPENHVYGQMPIGFKPLSNPSGLAPGLFYQRGDKYLMAAPGVPKEFHDMISLHFPKLIGPLVKETAHQKLLNFRTKGIPEEKIFGELCPHLWEQLSKYGQVASLPHLLGVDIGVFLTAHTPEEMSHNEQQIRLIMQASAIYQHIWHEGFQSVEELILQECLNQRVTIGFAESCTGGLCSHRMTNISGASKAFWGSVVSYDNSVKQNTIHVPATTLKNFGAVSEETAQAMAIGAREQLGVDIAVAITGIAGPTGGSPEKPVGTVCIGIASVQETHTYRLHYRGDREMLKNRFAQAALFTLLDHLRRA